MYFIVCPFPHFSFLAPLPRATRAFPRLRLACECARRWRFVPTSYARRGVARHTWLQPSLQLSWDQALRNSPIRHIPNQAGKMIVTHGVQETPEFHRQSQEFMAAWQSQGLEGEYLPQPDKNHFTAIDGFLDADSLLCSSILSLMSRIPALVQ